MYKRFILAAVSMTFLLSFTSCDLLTQNTMGVGILTKTPNITESGVVDTRLLDAVGELPIDQVVAATAFVGERTNLQEMSPPEGISGATVRIRFTGVTVDLHEVTEEAEAKGTYMALSTDVDDSSTDEDLYVDENLEYRVDNSYTVFIDILGDYYELSLTAPPPIPAENVTFNGGDLNSQTFTIPGDEDLSIATHPRNSDLTVAWESEDPDKPQNAFITLAKIEYTGASDMSEILDSSAWSLPSESPYTNFPQDPQDFLSLVVDEPETEHTLSADMFNQPGLYILLLTATDLDTDNSMAIGSAGLGGIATPFVFMVQP